MSRQLDKKATWQDNWQKEPLGDIAQEADATGYLIGKALQVVNANV
jgi:hypothetical protein